MSYSPATSDQGTGPRGVDPLEGPITGATRQRLALGFTVAAHGRVRLLRRLAPPGDSLRVEPTTPDQRRPGWPPGLAMSAYLKTSPSCGMREKGSSAAPGLSNRPKRGPERWRPNVARPCAASRRPPAPLVGAAAPRTPSRAMSVPSHRRGPQTRDGSCLRVLATSRSLRLCPRSANALPGHGDSCCPAQAAAPARVRGPCVRSPRRRASFEQPRAILPPGGTRAANRRSRPSGPVTGHPLRGRADASRAVP